MQYRVGTDGSITMAGFEADQDNIMGSYAARASLRTLLADGRGGALRQQLVRILQRSIIADVTFRASVIATPLPAFPDVTYTGMPDGAPSQLADDPLARQLRIVARTVRSHAAPGMKRQVFMDSIDGFDIHEEQMREQTALMQRVAQAISYFQGALGDMQDQVTLFTASEFGRTLASNREGSDHGWGSHHFVGGGALRGGRMVGRFPETRLSLPDEENPDEVGSGRLLPSTSVEQLAGTLGRWFGVADGELDNVLPSLRNFTHRDLGLF